MITNMSTQELEAYGKRNVVKRELLVRLRPTKIVAEKDIAGW